MVVFDLDDTLYKERDYVLSGFHAVARQVALESGLPARAVLARMLADSDPMAEASRLGPSPLSSYVHLYRCHYPSIALEPAALSLLASLKERGVAMAMITDGRSAGQRNKYLALGLDRFIPPERLLISEETGEEKTSPLPFRTLMDRFPDEAHWTYIGDNPQKDFLHPGAMGWTTIMLADPLHQNIHPQDIPSLRHAALHTVVTLPQALQFIPETQ